MRATCCINPVRASTTQRPHLTPSENYESRDLRSPVAKLKSQQARTDAPRVSLCASPHLESLNDILVLMKNRVKSPFEQRRFGRVIFSCVRRRLERSGFITMWFSFVIRGYTITVNTTCLRFSWYFHEITLVLRSGTKDNCAIVEFEGYLDKNWDLWIWITMITLIWSLSFRVEQPLFFLSWVIHRCFWGFSNTLYFLSNHPFNERIWKLSSKSDGPRPKSPRVQPSSSSEKPG